MEKSLNRSLMVVTPRLPFATWAGSLASREDAGEVRDMEDEDRILEKLHQRIFANQLEACVKDPGRWPPERNLDTFLEWFDVSFHGVVLDLGDDEPAPA